jgi:hypothetical protein
MRITFYKVFNFFFFFFLLFSCSTETPEINGIFFRVNNFRDLNLNKTYQKLSVFIQPDDGDGMEDLFLIYLLHDEEELYWKLESSNWCSRIYQGNNWIGSSSFVMPDNSPFPSGSYRIYLEDLSGESVEKSFYLYNEEELPPSDQFPYAQVKNNSIYLINFRESSQIWFYNIKGEYIGALEINASGLPYKTILSFFPVLKQDFIYYCYTSDLNKQIGYISGPYQDTIKID